MNIWNRYTALIKDNILTYSTKNRDLKYWQDAMFVNTIIYIMPLSLIALIPSFIWALKVKLYIMCCIDLLSLVLLLIIAFKKNINIKSRKFFFIGLIFALSTSLLLFAGLNSSLFLLAACFLATMIYDFKNQYRPALINVYISICYIILCYLKLTPIPTITFEPFELFAVISNLIFLSFLISALLPKLFHGLDESYKNSIEHNNKIEKQNAILTDITYIQSHVVRAPLSRLLAIADLLKEEDLSEEEISFYIKNLIISTKELDDVIHEIVSKSESIDSISNTVTPNSES